MKRAAALFVGIACTVASLPAQSPIDLGTISRIKQEALMRSRAMDHVAWMSDVYGPRVTGTPNFQRASEWAMKQLTEWGLANVHQERFAFGQGWRVERFSAHMIAPEPQPIIGYPRTFSPSTKGTISGDVARVDIRSDADFAKYKGTLKDKIVLPQAARRVRMLEDRIILRMNEEDTAEALTTPIPGATGATGATGDRCDSRAWCRWCDRSDAQRAYCTVLRDRGRGGRARAGLRQRYVGRGERHVVANAACGRGDHLSWRWR